MESRLIERWLRGCDAITVIDTASASLVREAVREVAAAQGLDAARAGAIVTAASELVTNQLFHARDGAICVRAVARGEVLGVEVIAADQGPGIDDPAAAMAGGVASRTGLGVGLSGARRLADEMDVDVRGGEGTCVWVRKFARPVLHRAEIGIFGTPHPDERVSGDDAAFVRIDEDVRVAVADGLGHGPAARAASSSAIEAFLAAPREGLAATMDRCSHAAVGTRGSVMSLARLVEVTREVEHLAVGNVITHITRRHESVRFSGAAFVLGLPGYRSRTVLDESTLGPRDVLVMFTDGLTSRVAIEEAMLDEPAVAIAARLVQRYERKTDDALVLVVRLRRGYACAAARIQEHVRNQKSQQWWTAALLRALTTRLWSRRERARAETALRESEAGQVFLLRLSDALRPLADPIEVQRVAIAALGRHLGVNRALYFEVQPDLDTVVAGPSYVAGVAEMLPPVRISDFGEATAAQLLRGETVVIHDVLADDRFVPGHAVAFAAIEHRAGIGMPLLKEGRLVSIVAVHQSEPRTWTAADIALLEAVAERTWAAVERARAEESLRESRHALALEIGALARLHEASTRLWRSADLRSGLEEILGEGIALLGADMGNVQLVNPTTGMLEIVAQRGFTSEFLEYFREVSAEHGSACGRSLRTGESITIEDVDVDAPYAALRGVAASAGYRAVVTVPLLNLNGEPLGMLSTHFRRPHRPSDHDLRRLELYLSQAIGFIERQRIAAARRKLEAQQSFLLELADTLRPLTDAAQIEREATRMLGETLAASRVFYARIEADGDTAVLRSERSQGASGAVVSPSISAFAPELASEWRAGRTTVTVDVDLDPRLPDTARAACASVSSRAGLCVPLVKRGRLVALLGLDQSTPRAWTEEEVALAEATAERTWATIDKARVEEALRQSEARLQLALDAAKIGMTEHKRAEEEATAARTQAELANRATDEFLATLGHELRTPLAAMLLWARALRSGAVPAAEVSRALDAIAHSADSQSRLIEDLLDLSRLTSRKLVLSVAPTDVATVVRGAADMVSPMMSAKKLAFDVELDERVGVAVLDGGRLNQILGNLLANAAKFTPEGGAVTLRVRKRDADLEVEVADTGEGISPELLPRLFERFWQADMAETRQHMGLGIGLALAKQLVELHGGTIEGRSEGLGRGAVFCVRLPWLAADEDDGSHEGATAGSASTARLAGVTVLLVEDDPNTREAMQWVLERVGATVVPAATAAEAIDAFEAASVDVVVSDLALPGVSGLALIERIAAECRRRGRPPPPSCAVSAHVRDLDRQRALDAGFDMYLAKPVSGERLIEAVADLRDVLRSELARV